MRAERSERSERCGDCGSVLAADQRYCLGCGARLGSRSPQLVEMLRRLHDRPQPTSHPAAPGGEAVAKAGSGRAPSGLRLPPSRVSALLVLVFVGFGVLLGGAAGSRVQDTLAASARPQLKLLRSEEHTSELQSQRLLS
jgi:hypothetical protein